MALSTSINRSPNCCTICTSRSSPNPAHDQQRQRAGGEQKRLGGAPLPRPQPHPAPPRGAGQHFLKDLLAPFVNYHRPCQFPVDKTDEKGRVRKVYRYENVTTPYQKLKSLAQAEQYLCDGVTFEQLDRLALATDSFSMAKTVKETRNELFREIARRDQSAA